MPAAFCQSSTVAGAVAIDDGPSQLSGIAVTAVPIDQPADPKSAPPPQSLHAATKKNGSFAFTALPPGKYRLCFQGGIDVADPCEWLMTGWDLDTTAGKSASIPTVKLPRGFHVRIRIDDHKRLLDKNDVTGTSPAHLVIGVWSGAFFHPLRQVADSGPARNYDLLVPFGLDAKLLVQAINADLKDASGTLISGGGVRAALDTAHGRAVADYRFALE